ncbi:Yippee/Mis18, partial [Trichophaea hybrida]
QTILTCTRCHTHLCNSSCIISKTFTGRHGQAYLLTSSSFTSESVTLSEPRQRQLVTGLHTVSDFRCRVCDEELGWRYDAAEEKSQRYKVGKWILERERV